MTETSKYLYYFSSITQWDVFCKNYWFVFTVGLNTTSGTKVKPDTFFSETISTIVTILTCTMGTSFTKFRLLCHRFCFIFNTFFSLLRAKLFAGSLNLFAEALQGLLPDFFTPLLNQRTQSPTELTSVASSPYPLLRHLWIYIGLELSAVRNSTSSLYLVRTSTTSAILHRYCFERPWPTESPIILVEMEIVAIRWVRTKT